MLSFPFSRISRTVPLPRAQTSCSNRCSSGPSCARDGLDPKKRFTSPPLDRWILAYARTGEEEESPSPAPRETAKALRVHYYRGSRRVAIRLRCGENRWHG